MMKPCIDCGEPSDQAHCPQHRPKSQDVKAPAPERGYDNEWKRLSKRARRLQPFCIDCGAVEDLQADHSPEAWKAKAAGKRITLAMIDVVCGRCNRDRGAARGDRTRGHTPSDPYGYPAGQGAIPVTHRVWEVDGCYSVKSKAAFKAVQD